MAIDINLIMGKLAIGGLNQGTDVISAPKDSWLMAEQVQRQVKWGQLDYQGH